MKTNNLPLELVEHLYRIENSDDIIDKIAVFDFDETLIDGDIEEAVYCYLASQNVKLNYSWATYTKLLNNEEYETAYTDFKTSFKGLSVNIINQAVQDISESNISQIEFIQDDFSYSFPVPKPNQIMIEFIEILKSLHYDIYIISASTEIIVRKAAEIWFGLAPEKVIGMKQKLIHEDNESILSGEVIDIKTTYKGKAEAIEKYISQDGILIGAGDSMSDVPLLQKVKSNGLIILREKKHKNHVLNEIKYHSNIVII